MPKIVDHEERRQVLVEAAWRVIARDGIENVTVRLIAKESGFSAGTLSHYFADKDDILRVALEKADDNIRRRLDAIPPDVAPLERLVRVLSESLPLDEERTYELTLDVNFWARALNQPALRKLQHADHDVWRNRVRKAVESARQAGELSNNVPAEDLADVLVAFVDGIGLQALVYPELMTTERVEHLLATQIRSLQGAAAVLNNPAQLPVKPSQPKPSQPKSSQSKPSLSKASHSKTNKPKTKPSRPKTKTK